MISNEDRLSEAVEHLQEAATQMIEAARAVLDLTEDLVKDPTPLLSMLSALADVAGAKGRRPESERSESSSGEPNPSSRPKVQHIRVS